MFYTMYKNVKTERWVFLKISKSNSLLLTVTLNVKAGWVALKVNAWDWGKTHNLNMKIRLALQIWKSPNALLLVFCIFYIIFLLRAETKKTHFMMSSVWRNMTNIIHESALPEHPHPGKLKATQPEGNYRWLAWGEVQLGKAGDTSLVQITRRDI